MKALPIFGVLALLLFLLGDGARMVYAAYFLYVEFNPFILIFCFSALSLSLSFAAYVMARRKASAQPPPGGTRRILLYVLINIFTFTSWTSGYYAINYMVPAVFSAIAVSIGPILLAVFFYRRLGIWNLMLSALALVTTFLLSTSDLSTIKAEGGADALLFKGGVLSIVCGASIFINTLISKALNALDESPIKINALRVPLVFIVAVVACYRLELFPVIRAYWQPLLGFTFFLMFVTQLCLQYSIKWIGASFVTIGISTAPIFAVLVQSLFFDKPIDRFLVFIIILNGIALVAMARIHILRKSPT